LLTDSIASEVENQQDFGVHPAFTLIFYARRLDARCQLIFSVSYGDIDELKRPNCQYVRNVSSKLLICMYSMRSSLVILAVRGRQGLDLGRKALP
jgi:hypothetical protein